MLKAAATRCGQFRDCGRRPLTNSVAGRWAITSAGGGCRSCAGARQPCTGTKRAAMGALTGPVEVMVCASGGRERRGKCAIRPISGPKGGPLEGIRLATRSTGVSLDSPQTRSPRESEAAMRCNAWVRRQVQRSPSRCWRGRARSRARSKGRVDKTRDLSRLGTRQRVCSLATTFH